MTKIESLFSLRLDIIYDDFNSEEINIVSSLNKIKLLEIKEKLLQEIKTYISKYKEIDNHIWGNFTVKIIEENHCEPHGEILTEQGVIYREKNKCALYNDSTFLSKYITKIDIDKLTAIVEDEITYEEKDIEFKLNIRKSLFI